MTYLFDSESLGTGLTANIIAAMGYCYLPYQDKEDYKHKPHSSAGGLVELDNTPPKIHIEQKTL